MEKKSDLWEIALDNLLTQERALILPLFLPRISAVRDEKQLFGRAVSSCSPRA
jgi:hypothetical protein